MNRSALVGPTRWASVAVVLVGLVSGCSGAEPTAPAASPAAELPTTSVTPDAPGPTDPAGVTGFNVYFTTQCPKPDVQRDPCLVTVGERRSTTDPNVLDAAVRVLAEGPNAVEASIGLTGHIAPRVQFQGVTLDSATGVATVRFNRYFETANTRPQVAQVVYTLTQFPGVRAVKFLIDGEDNGATGVPPMSRADLADRTPTNFVDTPWLNAAVGRRFRLRGSSSAAAGQLVWRLESLDGRSLAAGPLTTGPAPVVPSGAAPPPRPFETVIELAPEVPAGPAVLVVGADTGDVAASRPITIG